MTNSLLTALIGLGTLLSGCALHAVPSASVRTQIPPGHQTVYVTPLDKKGTIYLHVGDELLFELPTQNGGQWELLQSPEPVLFRQPNVRRAGVTYQPERGGIIYTFRANSVGAELVSFAPRPSNTYNSAGFNFNLYVEVAAVDGPIARQ